ncbi:MAG: protein translocase subunit SecF [Atribacterota bacterium]|jgi:preprotein translocase subunit SecF|nr:protein translocase subunit SecF [Atribacterota bacterium]MDD4897076.1 protein translocase subunit SecF [Atribacterota bacterium]MDD5637516.1 protein translocase subunit SecF [Atribacterota bacterium]
MDIIKDTNIQFVSRRKIFYIISGLIILIGIISLLFLGFNFGIDFAGGTLIQLEFNQENITVAEIRNVLGEINLASSTIQLLSDNEFVVRTAQIGLQERQNILETIEHKIGPFEVLRVEMVGPVIGESLKRLAVLAIIFAFIGIILYITIRFQFRYAITSIIALGHDVLIALGIISILQKEITIPIIAAILTIVGYSLNNTIVIFDRLRENLKLKLHSPLEEVIDLSINQSLSRTINTALTTLLPVLALYFFGGTLSDFAFVLLVGITVGTYSSICIAGPLLLELKKRGKVSTKTIPSTNQRVREQEVKITKKVKSKKVKKEKRQ